MRHNPKSTIYVVTTVNPDTGETLYLKDGVWVDSIQDAEIYTATGADSAIARVEMHNRQMDPEDRLYPTRERLFS